MKLVKDINQIKTKNTEISDEKAEEAVKILIQWLGEDPNREGLLSTPKRVIKAYREYFRGYVICEKHSFLATNVIVHPNVTIGEGAVVGSGSIVTKDLEPWGIYMGTPARKIRDRPKTSILEKEKEIRNEYNIKEEFIEDIFENIR